ncbi:MAG TPA: hypothetical protein PKD86_13355, partial [Gemmatales bacterium]|nr:hypothetical protein [Gemmatales bacterium]
EVSFYGEAKFMRIDEKSYGGMILAREMLPDGKVSEENYEKYLFTGAYLYTFLPREKTVLVQGLAPQDTGQPPGAAMPFFFGMKKDELRRRYQLEVVKIDEHYTYLGVRPLLASLQQDFHYARLVVLNHDYVKANAQGQQALWIPRYMPKQLYWIEPNKSEVTWDMVMILRNPPETVVKRDDFDRNRQIPPGWKQQNFEQPKAPLPGGPVPPPRRGP